MSAQSAPAPGSDPALQAVEIVETYLRLHMIPDPDAARAYCAPGLEIRFTGNRLMHDPAEATAFKRARYKWVKKKFGPTHVVAGGSAAETTVYQSGTLYAAWLDGTPFDLINSNSKRSFGFWIL